jgi:hypothetical protein
MARSAPTAATSLERIFSSVEGAPADGARGAIAQKASFVIRTYHDCGPTVNAAREQRAIYHPDSLNTQPAVRLRVSTDPATSPHGKSMV